jgi:hypothetical protein
MTNFLQFREGEEVNVCYVWETGYKFYLTIRRITPVPVSLFANEHKTVVIVCLQMCMNKKLFETEELPASTGNELDAPTCSRCCAKE